MDKMWAGRFQKPLSEATNDFNSSIRFDCAMYRQDIRGSMAHAAMLGAQGIIAQSDADAIIGGLNGILDDLDSGKLTIDPNAEDIHMFVEQELTARLGETGKRLHTARSRNDQVALDLRMYLKDKSGEITARLVDLLRVLIKLAKEHELTIMPGYTHLQRAQPITLAHHLMAYAEMFARDIDRLKDCTRRTDVLPLGSCALAGTTYPIDRARVAAQLGFSKVGANSLDGVSDRDFVIELASCIAIAMTHLSRLSEEIILWCSWEFKFVELDDAYATGSSIMPQKKNPDIAELVRGKCGRVYGNLMGILTVMKGLPLAYNKDMQEDKEGIFDSVDTLLQCLPIFTDMLATMTVLKENMRKAGEKGFINATDCADYLVKKGFAFRSAYKVTGQLVAYAIARGKSLNDLTLEEFRSFEPAFDESVYRAIDLDECMLKRTSQGGPAPESVRRQIRGIEEIIADYEKNIH